MKDGFYLAVYIYINPRAHVHEFIKYRHDQNISLWKKEGQNIELVHYWELERMTGLKMHKRSFYSIEQAQELINRLLKTYNLTLNDMTEIWGTPELQTSNDYHSLPEYPQLSYHSVLHLFSSVLMDSDKFFNSKIIGLAVDAGPDKVIDNDINNKYFYCGCYVDNGKINVFPVASPGFIWRYARKRFDLREGSLMALSSASTSEAYIKDDDFEKLMPDTFSTFADIYKYVDNFIKKIECLDDKDAGTLFNGFDERFSKEDNRISMVMKHIQKLSLKIIDKTLDKIFSDFNVNPQDTYIAMSGGYALNCPTNSYLMSKYSFKGFIAPPCVSDTGLSMGIALYAFYKKMGFFNFQLATAFYGNEDNSLTDILSSEKYKIFIESSSTINLQEAVKDIQEAPVVWFQDRSEIGPRALGHRSIIASPNSNKIKDRLNEIKLRQWWRPVAPIILAEEVSNWFEDAYLTPFMLNTFQVRQDKIEKVPAILHLDGSARVQTLTYDENPLLYKLIKAFDADTNIPIICNTSLNDRGEPIIDTIEEALNFALRKEIEIIYVNGNRIILHNHNQYTNDKPEPRQIEFNIYKNDAELKNLQKKHNPYNISREALMLYYHRPEICSEYDLDKEEDAIRFKSFAEKTLESIEFPVILDF